MEKEKEKYVQKFYDAGYIGEEDVEHLPLITKDELVSMGVTKKGYFSKLQRLF